MAGKQPRAKVRLRLDRGTALLKQLGVSSVMCAILDLSENGCQCRISLADVDEDTAASWRKLINPGRILTLEVTEPAELRHLQFSEAEVRWVKAAAENCLDFGVLLKNLDPEQVLTLNQAMMTLASTKLRKASPPGQAVAVPPPSRPQARVQSPAPSQSSAQATTIIDTFLPPPSDKPALAPKLPEPAPTPAPPPPKAPSSSPRLIKPTTTIRGKINTEVPAPKSGSKKSGDTGVQELTASGRWRLSSGNFTSPANKGGGAPLVAGKKPDPQEMPRADTSNLERQKRHVLAAPVFYQFRNEQNQPLDQETYDGRTIDFNEGGFQIEGPLPLGLKPESLLAEKWRLVCIIQAGGHELAAKSRVRSLDASPNGNGLYLWGLQIVEMPDEDRRILREIYIRAGLTVIVRRR
ncbi:MAG TPA: PilZ domain-containing protein [Planctomycetota bacterium]|nr:PilZ domain-containing protein [Planctomycetota bacterium]